RNFTFIKCVTSSIGKELQRARQASVPEDLSVSGRSSIDQIRLRCLRRLAEKKFLTAPLAGDDFRNRKAFVRISDRRLEQPRHGKLSVTSMQCKPSGNRTRYRDGMH